MLNCVAFRPFQVLEFPWAFGGDPDARLKLWIVARNLPDAEILLVFKAASTTKRWDNEPLLLEGAVEYKGAELDGFKKFDRRTIVEPVLYNIPYSHLRSCYLNTKIELVDEMPVDFLDRILAAVNNHPEWNKQKKKTVLQRIGISV